MIEQIQSSAIGLPGIWVYFLAPAAVIVSASIAYIGVRRTLLESRQQTKDRATLEYIMNRNKDDRFFDCFKVAIDADANDNLDIRKYVAKEHSSSKEVRDLRYILNQYEYLSVGVKNNTYNETMLKSAIYSTTVRLYQITEPYIKKLNESDENNKSAYCEFRELAERWIREGKDATSKENEKSWYQFW